MGANHCRNVHMPCPFNHKREIFVCQFREWLVVILLAQCLDNRCSFCCFGVLAAVVGSVNVVTSLNVWLCEQRWGGNATDDTGAPPFAFETGDVSSIRQLGRKWQIGRHKVETVGSSIVEKAGNIVYESNYGGYQILDGGYQMVDIRWWMPAIGRTKKLEEE